MWCCTADADADADVDADLTDADVDPDVDADGGGVIKQGTQLQPYFARCSQIWKYLTIYKWDCKNQKAACISNEIVKPWCENIQQAE